MRVALLLLVFVLIYLTISLSGAKKKNKKDVLKERQQNKIRTNSKFRQNNQKNLAPYRSKSKQRAQLSAKGRKKLKYKRKAKNFIKNRKYGNKKRNVRTSKKTGKSRKGKGKVKKSRKRDKYRNNKRNAKKSKTRDKSRKNKRNAKKSKRRDKSRKNKRRLTNSKRMGKSGKKGFTVRSKGFTRVNGSKVPSYQIVRTNPHQIRHYKGQPYDADPGLCFSHSRNCVGLDENACIVGESYRNMSITGKSCIYWSEGYETDLPEWADKNQNKCQNPNRNDAGPWCYVDTHNTKEVCFKACSCAKSSNVYIYEYFVQPNRQTWVYLPIEEPLYNYITVDDEPCYNWTDSEGNKINRRYPTLESNHNQCSNPDKAKKGPWCYTDDDGHYGYCYPQCGDLWRITKSTGNIDLSSGSEIGNTIHPPYDGEIDTTGPFVCSKYEVFKISATIRGGFQLTGTGDVDGVSTMYLNIVIGSDFANIQGYNGAEIDQHLHYTNVDRYRAITIYIDCNVDKLIVYLGESRTEPTQFNQYSIYTLPGLPTMGLPYPARFSILNLNRNHDFWFRKFNGFTRNNNMLPARIGMRKRTSKTLLDTYTILVYADAYSDRKYGNFIIACNNGSFEFFGFSMQIMFDEQKIQTTGRYNGKWGLTQTCDTFPFDPLHGQVYELKLEFQQPLVTLYSNGTFVDVFAMRPEIQCNNIYFIVGTAKSQLESPLRVIATI